MPENTQLPASQEELMRTVDNVCHTDPLACLPSVIHMLQARQAHMLKAKQTISSHETLIELFEHYNRNLKALLGII